MQKKPTWHSIMYTTGITGIQNAENAWHVQKYLLSLSFGVNMLHWDKLSSQYRESTSGYPINLEVCYRLLRLDWSHCDSISSLFSSYRHSCMSLGDWGLATARDVYIRQNFAIENWTSERRSNSLVRILAATEGHLRATLVSGIGRALESFYQFLPERVLDGQVGNQSISSSHFWIVRREQHL